MAKLPTNTDIISLITNNHKETQERLRDVEAQVKYTNGQVREIKVWQAVREDREQREAQSSSNPKGIDWTKWMWIAVALAASLIAIGQAIGGK